MSDTVVPLRDGITPPGEADPVIVQALEQLLEKARAGEVRGLAYAVLDRPDRGEWWFRVNAPLQLALIGYLQLLNRQAMCVVETQGTSR